VAVSTVAVLNFDACVFSLQGGLQIEFYIFREAFELFFQRKIMALPGLTEVCGLA
jgi:hypothetical protein